MTGTNQLGSCVRPVIWYRAVFDTQVLLSQIDVVAGSDNFERTISTFERNFSTNLIDLLNRIMDFSVSNCEHKLMNVLYRSVSFTAQIYFKIVVLFAEETNLRYLLICKNSLPYLTLPYLRGGCTRNTSAEASISAPCTTPTDSWSKKSFRGFCKPQENCPVDTIKSVQWERIITEDL